MDLERCSSALGTFVACCPRDAPEVEFAIPSKLLKGMAGTTGLEPAASAVTGQRSNQLNYVPTCICRSLEPARTVASAIAIAPFACTSRT